jgi:transcriptional regulator with XRE-family HTH domain
MSAAFALRRGDRVEVHARSQGPCQWVGGVVDRVVGKGAFVETDVGHENFYHWKAIRLPGQPPSPAKDSGSVVALAQREREDQRSPATLRSATSLSSAVVPGPALSRLSPEPVIHRSTRQAILMDLHPGAQTKNVPRKLHDPTPIGDAFRAYRLRQGHAQNEMADRLDITGSTLSQIELGDMVPNDDLILAFAEESGTPLDELIKLRENSRVPPKSAVLSIPPAPSPPPSPPAPSATLPAFPPPPAAGKPSPRPFSEIVMAVEALVPMPADAARRARWIQVVTELYELREP